MMIMPNPHSMHQYLKHAKKERIKVQDVDNRIIKYFTSSPDEALNLLKRGETGFFLLILVVDRQPNLILTKMGSSRTRFAPEVIGVIDDIPQDLLIKEIQNQGGNLNVDRQYIVSVSDGIIINWIKEERIKQKKTDQGKIREKVEQVELEGEQNLNDISRNEKRKIPHP